MTNSRLLEDYLLSKSIYLAKIMKMAIMTSILHFDYLAIQIYYFGIIKNRCIYIYQVILLIQITWSYILLFAVFAPNNQLSYKLFEKCYSILKILHLYTNYCILWSHKHLKLDHHLWFLPIYWQLGRAFCNMRVKNIRKYCNRHLVYLWQIILLSWSLKKSPNVTWFKLYKVWLIKAHLWFLQ